jgi:ABC-type uncharacterized transport system fused permease/ATPase subunit
VARLERDSRRQSQLKNSYANGMQLARYAEQWLGLVWREWLTRSLLNRYLEGRTYLRPARH